MEPPRPTATADRCTLECPHSHLPARPRSAVQNIGALYRTILAAPAVPLDVFNPFDDPPPFAGRLEMIGMAKSGVEDAYEAAIGALEGFPPFTLTQARKLIGYFGGASGSEGGGRAKHTVAKNAYRAERALQPHLVSRGGRKSFMPVQSRTGGGRHSCSRANVVHHSRRRGSAR
jgi:hypothetical protein